MGMNNYLMLMVKNQMVPLTHIHGESLDVFIT